MRFSVADGIVWPRVSIRLAEFRKAISLFGSPPGIGVARLYAMSGRAAEARQILRTDLRFPEIMRRIGLE
jgi:hypothetical protein